MPRTTKLEQLKRDHTLTFVGEDTGGYSSWCKDCGLLARVDNDGTIKATHSQLFNMEYSGTGLRCSK